MNFLKKSTRVLQKVRVNVVTLCHMNKGTVSRDKDSEFLLMKTLGVLWTGWWVRG